MIKLGDEVKFKKVLSPDHVREYRGEVAELGSVNALVKVGTKLHRVSVSELIPLQPTQPTSADVLLKRFAEGKFDEVKGIDSSTIASWAYDKETWALLVGFKRRDGGTSFYLYPDVPPEVHLGAQFCESHGKYFNRMVKGSYDFIKLEDLK